MQKTSTTSIKPFSVEKDNRSSFEGNNNNNQTIPWVFIQLFSWFVFGYSLQSPSFQKNAFQQYFGSSALFVSCGKDATEMKSSYKILLIPFWKTLLYIKRFAFYPPPTHMNPNYDPALINSDRHLPRRSLSLIMVDLSECRVFVCFPSATRETELINFSTLWRKGHFETINKDSGEESAELSIITSNLMNRELC